MVKKTTPELSHGMDALKVLSNLKAYDFARHVTGGIKRGIDLIESAKALRKIADSLETDQVWLREVSVLTKVQAEEYVTTTVILTIMEKQSEARIP